MQYLKSIGCRVFNWLGSTVVTCKEKMNSTNLVLIRHGESEWNADNLFCGWHDAGLSEEGIKDASRISAAALIDKKLTFSCAFASALRRSQHSLRIILEELNSSDLPTTCDWHLNERHYGNLTGFNKRQMADKYGEEQVQIWRRSFEISPPPITPDNPYYDGIRNNPSFKDIPAHKFPDAESLKTVMDRVVPFFEETILERIVCGDRVLVCAHGTVVRALIKHIDNISDENISSFNVPNSIPCVYEFDVTTRKPRGKVQFLADENYLNKQMEKTASIGK